MFTFVYKYSYMAIKTFKKDTTAPITFRVDKALKKKLQLKYKRKLAEKVIPHLKSLCA